PEIAHEREQRVAALTEARRHERVEFCMHIVPAHRVLRVALRNRHMHGLTASVDEVDRKARRSEAHFWADRALDVARNRADPAIGMPRVWEIGGRARPVV